MSQAARQPGEDGWEAHPAREHPGKAMAVGLVVGACAAMSGAIMHDVPALPQTGRTVGIGLRVAFWGVLAAMIMVAVLNRFFFRSRYAIDAEGITAELPLGTRRLEWSKLRRFAHDERGGVLSTRAKSSWFEGSRTIPLLFGENGSGAIEAIRARLPKEAAS